MTVNITPVSVGADGVEYLLKQVGCARESAQPEAGERGADRQAERGDRGPEYYLSSSEPEAGDPPGVWMGSGLVGLGLSGGEVAEAETVRRVFGRLEHPSEVDEEGNPVRLGRRPMRFKPPSQRLAEALERERARWGSVDPEREEELTWSIYGNQRQAVGFFDINFSPAKSVSAYYALLVLDGREQDAATVWSAHQRAVAAAMGYLEREAGYARRGYHGKTRDGHSVGEFVAAGSWVGVRFDHETNRNGDPHMHSHLGVLNRVQCEDGAWRTIDSRALFGEKWAAAAIYEMTYEEILTAEHGVEFELREDGTTKEMRGISAELIENYSSRRGEIRPLIDQWVRDYTATHGRAPSAYEKALMADQAALATRNPKPDEPESTADKHARWGRGADSHRSEHQSARSQAADAVPEVVDRAAVITAAVADVQYRRASWTRADLMFAVRTQLGWTGQREQVESFVAGLADEALALGAGGVVSLAAPEAVATPPELCRESDGRSRFRPHRDERYATTAQLAAEERIAATARAGVAPALSAEQLVGVEAELATGRLNTQQREAVLGVLGSGRGADVLIGPPGTGKSFTVAELTRLWSQHHGPVLGLATSQAAAGVLTAEGLPAANITQFLMAHEPHPETGRVQAELPAGALLVVDETNMSATEALDRVRALAERAGAKLLFTGDQEQLDAISAGGMLRQLAGNAAIYQLAEPRRFTHGWEADASLALRRGEREALRAYDARGRFHEGPREAMADAALQNYLADTFTGQQSLLIARSAEQASELSARVRIELMKLGRVQADQQAVALADHNRASVGDLIQTRRNRWNLRTTDNRPVINRDVWQVVARTGDGDLWVQLTGAEPAADGSLPRVRLPKHYLAEYATLAYATTVHAAEGRTTDTCHFLVDTAASRPDLLVPITRGRERNVGYVITQEPADDQRRAQPLNSDKIETLGQVLDRDTAQRTATEVMRADLDHAEGLAQLGVIWQTVVEEHNQQRYADALVAVLGPQRFEQVADEDGLGRLMRALRAVELDGHDAPTLLREVVAAGPLTGLRSVSDGLRARVDRAAGRRPFDELDPATADLHRRYQPLLRAALGEATYERLGFEPAAAHLLCVLAGAERLGAEPGLLIREVVGQRELRSAESVADVLRWRIAHRVPGVDDAAPSPDPVAARAARAAAAARRGADTEAVDRDQADAPGIQTSWLARTPAGTGAVADYLRDVAAAMDARETVLGERAAAAAPQWAIEHLGTVPSDPVARADWTRRAGIVAGYREMFTAEDMATAIGPAPSHTHPEARAAWERSYLALGAPDQGRDYRAASSGLLREIVDAHAAEQQWAPDHVAPLLRATHHKAAHWHRKAALARVQADTTSDPAHAQRLRDRAERAAALAAEHQARLPALEEIHTARQAHYAHTERLRVDADHAQAELNRRDQHPDDHPGHTPSDRGTGAPEHTPTRANSDAERAEASSAWSLPHDLSVVPPPEVEPDTAESEEEAAAHAARQRASSTGRKLDTDPGAATDSGVGLEVLVAVHTWASARTVDRPTPTFGSPNWLALDDDDPAKHAAITAAATRWWNLGNPLDQDLAELQTRLQAAREAIGVTDTPDSDLERVNHRELARRRAPDQPDRGNQGERGERRDRGPGLTQRDEPSPALDELQGVFAYLQRHLPPDHSRDRATAADRRSTGPAPEFASPAWVELGDDDPAKDAAALGAALRWWNFGDDLDELRRAVEVTEQRAASHAIVADLHVNDPGFFTRAPAIRADWDHTPDGDTARAATQQRLDDADREPRDEYGWPLGGGAGTEPPLQTSTTDALLAAARSHAEGSQDHRGADSRVDRAAEPAAPADLDAPDEPRVGGAPVPRDTERTGRHHTGEQRRLTQREQHHAEQPPATVEPPTGVDQHGDAEPTTPEAAPAGHGGQTPPEHQRQPAGAPLDGAVSPQRAESDRRDPERTTAHDEDLDGGGQHSRAGASRDASPTADSDVTGGGDNGRRRSPLEDLDGALARARQARAIIARRDAARASERDITDRWIEEPEHDPDRQVEH